MTLGSNWVIGITGEETAGAGASTNNDSFVL